jgi:hypothetical protein
MDLRTASVPIDISVSEDADAHMVDVEEVPVEDPLSPTQRALLTAICEAPGDQTSEEEREALAAMQSLLRENLTVAERLRRMGERQGWDESPPRPWWWGRWE